ncbi:hypothetical protein ACG0Z4_05500 [Enterocloster aldenensis]|uniref:hypothetical protein n=1 Tax=Enterocloster aldenensis TaxID=358742 RepID=UPI004026962F
MERNYKRLCMEYISLLESDIPNKYTKQKNISKDVDFRKVPSNSKGLSAIYENMQKDIIVRIQEVSKEVSCLAALKMAFFCERNTRKKLMYDNDLDMGNTYLFKVFNISFCAIIKVDSSNSPSFNKVKERNIIKKMCGLAGIYCYNVDFYNRLKYQEKEKVEDFYDDLDNKSMLDHDMHTYSIENDDLDYYLKSQSYDINGLQKIAESLLGDFYFLWNGRIDKIYNEEAYNLKNNNSDELLDIIELNNVPRFSNKMQKFISKFTLNSKMESENIIFEYNEMIFGYSDNRYLYIAKKIMMDTQELIGNFCLYGQYNGLVNYFYPNNYDRIMNLYNKLMTYKITDLLMKNNYTIPMEKKKVENKMLCLPRVEIEDYPKADELKIGDIDVLFYSPYTETLYILEYKNYEMFVTSKGAIEKEEKKVIRDKIISRMKERKQVFEEYIDEIMEKFFRINNTKAINVKSIVLSTKPNYYLRNCKNIDYFDWVDFKKEVDNNVL